MGEESKSITLLAPWRESFQHYFTQRRKDAKEEKREGEYMEEMGRREGQRA